MAVVRNGKTGKYGHYYYPPVDDLEKQLVENLISHESECLPYVNSDEKSFYSIVRNVIDGTEISNNEKYRISYYSKYRFEKLRKKFQNIDDDNSVFGNNWEWNTDLQKYEYHYYPLGEYLPNEKKVILYKKNIERVCAHDGVPYYCGVLATFIHELFHAVHHEVANRGGRPYDTIREMEEAMTEFSTLVFLKEMVSDNRKSVEWQNTFEWAHKSIGMKQRCLGDLPAYGFGYYLFDTLYWQASNDNAYKWIERYNQKVGAIDNKNRYVKWYQQMLNPEYPFKNEKLCLELLHCILFNL